MLTHGSHHLTELPRGDETIAVIIKDGEILLKLFKLFLGQHATLDGMDLSKVCLKVTSFFTFIAFFFIDLCECFAFIAIADNFFAGFSFDVHLKVTIILSHKLYFSKFVFVAIAIVVIVVIAFIFVAFFAIAFRSFGLDMHLQESLMLCVELDLGKRVFFLRCRFRSHRSNVYDWFESRVRKL